MRAVRFSLPPGEEESDEEEDDGGKRMEDEEGGEGKAELEGERDRPMRSVSQQHLAERGEGGMGDYRQKKKRDLFLGPCCSKAPSVSVWNCDGEILPYTEILCR